MRNRFPLLLKKRGRRRTGSPRWARAGDAFYHAMFVVVGLIGLWWSLTDVLLPEWRLDQEARAFEPTECRVVGTRVVTRPGLAEDEYCPELRVEFEPAGGQPMTVWTRHGAGRDSPSPEEAAAALRRFTVGDRLDCWYDPADPSRVILSVHRRWWPWLVLSIPVSLVASGVFGLARTLASSQSSPERRSYLWRGGLDLTKNQPATSRRSFASGLPLFDRIGESPGVRLDHRLPLDSTGGWRVMGMAVLCVLWNALAGVFVYQLAADYFSVGGRIGLVALVVIPLAATGAWMTVSLWRDAGGVGGGGVTRVEVEHHPLRLGQPSGAVLIQAGQMRVRALDVWLVCEEIATFRQGTDSRTATVETFREPLLRERQVEVAAGEPFERSFVIRLPEDAAPSFVSPHNEVRWSLEVASGAPKHPDWRRRFPLCVHPPEPSGEAPDDAARTPEASLA